MSRKLFSVLTVVGAVACASAGGPVYEFGPSEGPLRYDANTYALLNVETPDGEMVSRDTVRSTLVLDIGSENQAGRSVSTQFEALEIKVTGSMANVRLEGTELVGKPFQGTLKHDGTIEVSDAPDTPRSLRDLFDPAALFAELLVPLPPDADAGAQSWPVQTTVTSEAGWTLKSRFDGTARFAGDTTWNGQSARLIVSEGKFELEGKGMPAGAPSEVEMSMSGTSTRRYVWDAMRGVMLASRNETSAEGIVVVLDFDLALPTRATNVQEVMLRP